MRAVRPIAQPSSGSTLAAIEKALRAKSLQSSDAAVAYITSSGIYDFAKAAERASDGAWATAKKRWITSFDYCRTDPVALDALLDMPTSTVRIHDGEFCLEHCGTPKVPFHPKVFLLRDPINDFAIAGSGNLSRSGLSRGVEIGLALTSARSGLPEASTAASIKALRTWYNSTWRAAIPLNSAMLERYRRLYESVGNRRSPTPTEDDVLSATTERQALSGEDLRKLRVCRHLWIKMGNNRNRGPHLPSSQLMMKRLSRVFFGFPPADLPRDSFIGNVDISYGGGAFHSYSLYFSNNGMDKLNLPMPGTFGPASYEDKYLLFTQVGPHAFRVELGSEPQKRGWLKKSKEIDANFKMASGGREWGVF